MASVALQFQAARDPNLTIALLATISAAMIVWGMWRLRRDPGRYGLACLGAGGFGAIGATIILLTDSGGLWMLLLSIQIALAVGVFYWSVYGYLGPARMAGLLALRCAAILSLMLLLFKPALSYTDGSDSDKPVLAILVDRSGSMATADDASLPHRYRQCVRMLQSQQRRIERHFEPMWMHFAAAPAEAKGPDDLADLSPTGAGTDATDIAAAIRAAAAKGDAGDLAGIVVLSDGIHNAGARVSDAAVEARAAVHAVAVGTTSDKLAARRNVEIASADAPLEAVANNVTTVSVRVRVAGLAAAPLEVRLLAGDPSPADTQRLWTDRNVAALPAELKWTAAASLAGPAEQVRRLRVTVPPHAGEATAEDNTAELHVLVTEPRLRVLYVEGSIRPEYKFLKRLLMSDSNVRFLSLVRIASNRFWAQGGAGAAKLDRLPETPEDFQLFDVIVLGDLDRTFLTRTQMRRLRDWVNDGGGLLMLGGHNSFGPGGYGATDVEAALPVSCGPRSQPQETTPFVPQLTAAGEAHPVFRGVAPFFFGPNGRRPDQNLPKLADLLGCVTVPAAKPGAAVLAIHPTRQIDGKPLVVMAVQRVGAGRSAAFTADTTWQWDAPMRGLGRKSPYERFWGQLIRWLANTETKSRESKPVVMIRPDRSFLRVGQGPVRVLALVQDERGRAATNAQVTLNVTPVGEDKPAETLPMSPRGGERLFEAEFAPAQAGLFMLEAAARDAAGADIGADSQRLIVMPFSAEADRLGRNDPLLETIADRTGGRKVDLPALPDLIDHIVESLAARGKLDEPARATISPLYNFPLLFILFVALLTAEWLLRRRWHLR